MTRVRERGAPRLIVFDVDGTLQNSFLWWPRVLRAGLRRFAEMHRLAIDPPDDAKACAVVGMKDEAVWSPFLPEPLRPRWCELRAVVVPMEVAVMRSGESFLFPGVPELLRHLRGLGVRTALASNCRSTYFRAVLEGQGLGGMTDQHYCLDTPGVATKNDMVGRALAEAGTREAVMIGDREPDHAAALAHGIPFVWRHNDRCTIDGADAIWHGQPDQLLRQLALPAIT